MTEKVIAVDFDGTLCENKFPEIGEPKKDILVWLMLICPARIGTP